MFSKYFLFILFAISAFSCSDDKEDTTTNNNTSSDLFECSIDGVAYKITGNFAFAEKVSTDIFGIYGSEDQTKPGFRNVYISLAKEPTVGKYELISNDVGSGNILATSTGTLYSSNFPGGNGSVEITEKTSSRIKGTFSFVGVTASGEQKKVTGGKFDVRIK